MSINILVADDHEAVRRGVEAFLEGTEIEIIAEATTGRQAYRLTMEHAPDVVLMDVRMPEMDGLKALSRIKLERPETPVLMFSAYNIPICVARSVTYDAAGFLLKTCTRDELIDAIRKAAVGESTWTGEELSRATGSLTPSRANVDIEVPLTAREQDVLKQLTLGQTNKEIAVKLEISAETVKEHVQHILRKIGVTDRTQAAIWATRKWLD